jgi:hypothetical protein
MTTILAVFGFADRYGRTQQESAGNESASGEFF